MLTEPKLLVVDDEDVVCKSCTRIFSDRGINVESSTNSREGLNMALRNDYNAILLDIKMPELDGIGFLEELRKKNPDIPVMMITGYSSIPSAASAMRLGAADYISKPFTPKEIISAVERILQEDEPEAEMKQETVLLPTYSFPAKTLQQEFPKNENETFHFYHEAWLKNNGQEAVRVGAFLSRFEGMNFSSAQLPNVGDVVYQGLPIASFYRGDQCIRVITSPVEGEIIAVNPTLKTNPNDVWEDPCNQAWIAIVRPFNLNKDLVNAPQREVVLLTNSIEEWTNHTHLLQRLGCNVHTATTYSKVSEALATHKDAMLILDGAVFGISGPRLAQQVNREFPDAKIVVVHDRDASHENEYRMNKIFYYAVEPFSDHEIIDILHAAFRKKLTSPRLSHYTKILPKWIHRIQFVTKEGKSVRVLPYGNLLLNNRGVGQEIIESLLKNNSPLNIALNNDISESHSLSDEVDGMDHLVQVKCKEMNKIPGSIFVQQEHSIKKGPENKTHKVVSIYIQPNEDGKLEFSNRINNAVAYHIIHAIKGA